MYTHTVIYSLKCLARFSRFLMTCLKVIDYYGQELERERAVIYYIFYLTYK